MKIKIVYVLLFLCFFTRSVLAAGSGNIGTGGGELNSGKEGYTWPGIGYDGVRITIVDAESGVQRSIPIDFSNISIAASDNICHFGSKSKIDYRNGAALSPQISSYKNYKPDVPLPQIISGNSKQASIAEIRQYFCSEAAAVMISDKVGVPYEDIESGKYKLVIEPIIYIIYQNLYFAMTTTEAGLYNRLTGGDLGYHFPTVIMKNHALALFLEKDDLGFSAWTGSTTTTRTTDEMINILGIGIVSYQENQEPTEIKYDRQYRVDTDVIIAVELSTSKQKTPDAPAYATFKIDGQTYTHSDIYIPENGSQLAWIKWRTPSKPGTVSISITSNCNTSVSQITAEIVDLGQNIPPDPQANDRYDSFRIPQVPTKANISTLTWGEWDCWWHPDWVWHDTGDNSGYYCDHGWWQYEWISYSASLAAEFEATPDAKSPTAFEKTMKSGYGIRAYVSTKLRFTAPSSQLTGIQNVIAYFPEYDYQTYWRLLKRLDTGYTSTFEFQENIYSTYENSVHFTPAWYPDGKYSPYAECLDAWTPAGMLQVNVSDYIMIDGVLYDDWHIRPLD